MNDIPPPKPASEGETQARREALFCAEVKTALAWMGYRIPVPEIETSLAMVSQLYRRLSHDLPKTKDELGSFIAGFLFGMSARLPDIIGESVGCWTCEKQYPSEKIIDSDKLIRTLILCPTCAADVLCSEMVRLDMEGRKL